jgi:hypothetical protein
MSRLKEPNYFCSDYFNLSAASDLDEYLSLFRSATSHHNVVGESSTNYLSSRTAIGRIREFEPRARILVGVRNPVDLVYAYHSQILRSPLEDEKNFEVAWHLQEVRRDGRNIPQHCFEPRLIQYEEIGQLGSQLIRLLSIFPTQQVKIVLFDDLVANPCGIYREILDFLDLDDDKRREFAKVNENVQFKWDWARRIVASPLVRTLHHSGIRNTGLFKPLYMFSASKGRRAPLRHEFRAHLNKIYEPEVSLVEEITGRDLSHWLRPAPEPINIGPQSAKALQNPNWERQ